MGSFIGWMLGFFGTVGAVMLIREGYERYARNSLRRKIEAGYKN